MSFWSSVADFSHIGAVLSAAVALVAVVLKNFQDRQAKRVIVRMARRNMGLQKALFQSFEDHRFDPEEMDDLRKKIEARIDAMKKENKLNPRRFVASKNLISSVTSHRSDMFYKELYSEALKKSKFKKSAKHLA